MNAEFNTIIIYARDMRKTAEFYQKYFGFSTSGEIKDGLIELSTKNKSYDLLIHQAAKSIKLGQVGVKLVFSVDDVESFKKKSAELGLVFGSTHKASGYSFANAKDPDKNTVSISSRKFRKRIQ